MELPRHPQEEIVHILQEKGLNAKEAKGLAEAYSTNLKIAQARNLTPEPTFRDVIRLAEDTLKGIMRKEGTQTSSQEKPNDVSSVGEKPELLPNSPRDFREAITQLKNEDEPPNVSSTYNIRGS
jgi:hypothetical protein